MKLIDILPVEIWGALETETNEKFGLNAAVFDAEGNRITDAPVWGNRVCPAIRGTADGATHICARSHHNIAAQAQFTRSPTIEECDAGLVKIVVPIYVDDEYLGTFSGCGRPMIGEEIDAFYVGKVTGIPEHEIAELAAGDPLLSESESDAVGEFMARRVRDLIENVTH